jgi:hypothetical protein
MLKVNALCVLLSVAGCASPVTVEGDDVIVVDSVEAVLTQTEPLTICADEVAAEIDPTITQLLFAGLAYWTDVPDAKRYRVTYPGACDVPVTFVDEASFPWPSERTKAAAVIVGELEPGACEPVRVVIRESTWDDMRAQSLQYTVVFHELGHVVCLPHVEDPSDIMHKYGALP